MSLDASAATLRDQLRDRLIAASATPLPASGQPDVGVLREYLAGLVSDGAGALAVCAHTGRGPLLAPATREAVIRVAVATGVPVVVGVDGDDAPGQAETAARLGAAGLLVFALVGTDPLAMHDALWRAARLPMIAFDLYQHPYGPGTLSELLAHPGVAGLKVARLYDAVACQHGIAAALAADRLPVSGEDRMFGASYLWGAQAALVGIAAAAVPVTARVLRAWSGRRHDEFVAASAALDRFAAVVFGEPVDGYVQRMLWVAAAEGRIPPTHAVDAAAPALPAGERDRVIAAWREASA
jgi:4-hydroxy-tetrahydrodipicolinate synthase